jgi:branched-subunit amino acid aminotransferase/4-amino-4-deoxychorismate lyase
MWMVSLLPDHKAVIPVDDLAVLRGIGICDIMRTFHGMPYFIDEHIQRLKESGEKIGLALPWTNEQSNRLFLKHSREIPLWMKPIYALSSQAAPVRIF